MTSFQSELTIVFLILLVIFLAFNAFFALMETALTESHHGPLERLAENGDEDAKAALDLLDHPLAPLSLAQVGIAFTSILTGLCSGVMAAPLLAQELSFLPHPEAVSLLICLIVVTYVTLLFSEFLPKQKALQHPEETLMRHHKTLEKLTRWTSPLVAVLTRSANAVLIIFGVNPQVRDTVTEDEVKDLIEQGTEDGTFEKTEQRMVDNIFHLSDQTAYGLMTPRTQLLWLDLSDSPDHNLAVIRQSNQAVFPVGRDSLDDFCGVLYAKDLLNAAIAQKPLDLNHFIRKPMFVPRSMETFRVLDKFRTSGIHEAIVLDEYGGVVGFITLADILAEIVGDSLSNVEPDPVQITKRDDYSWYVDGLYPIDDFKEKFDIEELPDEDHDQYQTMGGFLTSYFGYIPKEGETCHWNDFTFEIVDMDRARIDKILLTMTPPKDDAEEKSEPDKTDK